MSATWDVKRELITITRLVYLVLVEHSLRERFEVLNKKIIVHTYLVKVSIIRT